MSAEVFHVSLVLKQGLWVFAQQSQIVVLREVRELTLRLVPRLRDLAGVYETMDVGRDPLISLEVGQAVDELVRGGGGGGRNSCIHVHLLVHVYVKFNR